MNNTDNQNGNSAQKGRLRNPDPIIQASDESGNRNQVVQPAETMLGTEKLRPPTKDVLLSDQLTAAQRPAQAAQSANDIIQSMLRFKWTILVVFLLVTVPLTAAIWTQIIPKYQARAEVRVRPIIPRLVFSTEDNGMIPLYNSFLNTQVSIIRSLTVLQRVLEKQEIQQTHWYRNPRKLLMQQLRGNVPPPLERLRDNLSVRPRNQTEIIDVSFMTTNAREAKLIMDTVLDQYIKYIGEMSDATEDTLYRQLVDQYKFLESDIQGREKVIAELHRTLGTEEPQELVASKRVNLDKIQVRLSELQQSISILEWDRNKLEELVEQADIDDSNSMTNYSIVKQQKYHEDAEWRKLDVNVRTIQHQIDNSLYSSNNPNMLRLEKDIEFAKELLQLRESQLDEQWQEESKSSAVLPTEVAGASSLDYEKELQSLEYQWNRAKHEEMLLIEDLKTQQAEFGELFESAQLLEKQSSELRRKYELFTAVQQRLDQKNIERNVPGSIEVSMWAFVPSEPYNDRRKVFTAMVLVMGLGLGSGAAFFRASRNQAIYTSRDLSLPMQVPFLGQIPLIHLKKPLGKALRNEVEQKHFLLIESVRVMRTVLLSRLNGRSGAAILITSSSGGTGKSSLTNVLGSCIAYTGKDVLMIDADFHKKTLSKWYNLFNKPGFLDFLNTTTLDKAYIYPTETPGLSIMPAGKHDAQGVIFDGVANGIFKTCIEKLFQQYKIILLDSSTVLPIADATIISSQVDGTIMVERELVSHRDSLISAIERLGSAGGRLLGVVFVGSYNQGEYEYGSNCGRIHRS